MKVLQVCEILEAKLPQFTDSFSDTVIDADISITTPGEVVVTTTSPHGLIVGDKFTLSGFDIETDFLNAVSPEVILYSHVVSSVVSTTEFTFNIVYEGLIGVASTGGKLHVGVRSFVSISENFAEKAYLNPGKQKLTAFVIDQGMAASRDRRSLGDSIQSTTRNTDFKLEHLNTFTILIFIPLNNDIIGKKVSSAVRDLLNFFMRSVGGQTLDTDFEESTSLGVTLTGMSPAVLNDSYLAQEYSFQEVEITTAADVNKDDFGIELTDISIEIEPVLEIN